MFGHKAMIVSVAAAAFSLAFIGTSPAHADTAQAWGFNYFGQLGNGTSGSGSYSSTPVAVGGLSGGVTAVAGGGYHSLAIQSGGAVAWGYNSKGQLGNNTTTDSNTPVAVTGLSSGVTAIAAGSDHSLAIQNGGALAWGYNYDGELGHGTSGTGADSSTPVAVTGLTSNITAVAAGFDHSLAIQSGKAYAWGSNEYGQLGDNTTTDSHAPVAVTGLTSGVSAIAAGFGHSLAIQSGGAVAWGDNEDGQLGNNTTTDSNTPVPVTGLSSGVTAIAAGSDHSLAIQNGNVYAWGSNSDGELGDGSTTDSDTPLLALDLGADLVDVAAASYSSYALSSDGSLWVWGDNTYYGELGLGDTTNRLSPTQLLAPTGYRFTSIDGNATGKHVVATLAPAPEPTSLALLGLGGIGLMNFRGRRHRS